jgi:hypothetical protein
MDPLRELRRTTERLAPHGRLVLSFSNKSGAGAAEQYTGNMPCFTRDEMVRLLNRAGLRAELVWNYGFPLAALIRPFLHAYYQVRHLLKANDKGQLAVDLSGLAHKRSVVGVVASLVLNSITIRPFCVLQMLFKDTDLGSSYLVLATRRHRS